MSLNAQSRLLTIALVGRPNVGKSTLFNRLTRSRDALVADFNSLTRDRQYGHVNYKGHQFIVIDTAGIVGQEEGIDAVTVQQSLQAVEEADLVLFMLDARVGLTVADQHLVATMRQSNKSLIFVANKTDGINAELAISDFYQLGAEKIYAISASHGRGLSELLADIAPQSTLPENVSEQQQAIGVKIAVVGRPNVGKSTLVNRLLGEDRVVVYDQPGTTRDSVYITYERDGDPYTLIDTAGIRRRKNIKETVEKFSIIKTLQAINDANVVILVIDAQEGIVDQDLHLLSQVIDAGRALVIAINKWDGLTVGGKQQIKVELDRRLRFLDFADIHHISALHGSGVGLLYGSVNVAFNSALQKTSTSKLTAILEQAVTEHPPPMINGRRIKLRFAHLGGSNPPIIVVHGNQTQRVPNSYQRYLEKTFRKALQLSGTPIRVDFKGSENPYAGKRNQLTERQIKRKRRMMSHVKKKK